MTPFDQFAIHQLAQTTGVSITPDLENSLLTLFRSAKEGYLYCEVDNDLPEALCAHEPNDLLPKKPLVKQGNRLYFQKNWVFEQRVRRKIADLRTGSMLQEDQSRFAAALEQEKHRLNPAQAAAISEGYRTRLTLFSGGPGTGKTYTAAVFIRILASLQDQYKVIISAPTGKAAAHLESVFQKMSVPGMTWESMTLHRLLKLRPKRQKLTSNFTIQADLVVVDEASMMDGYLLLHLLNAVGPNTRLLLLGDAHQLPPVEGISFFPEMADQFGQKLTQSIRMGEGMVASLAQAILEGKLDQIPRHAWISNEDRLIHELCKKIPSPHHTTKPELLALFQELGRFRILCALRQGPFGVDALNQKLLARFQAKQGSDWFAIPILIVQNTPVQELYNGTGGILLRKDGVGTAYFLENGAVRTISEKALPPYETAFCLSIHKSQGSEFDEVLLLFGPGSERFGKEALYTAVTRAKRNVEIWAADETLQLAIEKKSNYSCCRSALS